MTTKMYLARASADRFALNRLMVLLNVMLMCCSCAQTPHIYTMQPSMLETVRSEISTVGVDLSPELAETEVLLPAKGEWGGIKRGFVLGAAMPVMIGLVSPVPGGTALGVLVAPFTALIGSVHGAYAALPAEEIEEAEMTLEMAADRSRQKDHRQVMESLLVELGNRSTGINFVGWPAEQAAGDGVDEGLTADQLPGVIDTRLEVKAEKSGLRGRYSIDPPTEVFLEIRVRLIRTRDEAVLLDEHFTCASEQERVFKDWASRDGIHMIEEFDTCIPELAEKIVDDFFRIYPLTWKVD